MGWHRASLVAGGICRAAPATPGQLSVIARCCQPISGRRKCVTFEMRGHAQGEQGVPAPCPSLLAGTLRRCYRTIAATDDS